MHTDKYMPKDTLTGVPVGTPINYLTRKRFVFFRDCAGSIVDTPSTTDQCLDGRTRSTWELKLCVWSGFHSQSSTVGIRKGKMSPAFRRCHAYVGQEAQDVLGKVDGDHCLVCFRSRRRDAIAILSKSYDCMTLRPSYCLNSRDNGPSTEGCCTRSVYVIAWGRTG